VVGFSEKKDRLFYRTDTLPGSSGAPCFDADWKFLALHQGHSFESGNYNRGIPYALIADWLDQHGLWEMATQAPPDVPEVMISTRGVPRSTEFRFEPALWKLIEAGEGQQIEFKERAVEPGPAGSKSRLAPGLLKAVAAFMNSKLGGNVLVGIADDGTFVGIESEYGIVNKQKKDWNAFELWLSSALRSGLSDNAFENFALARYREQEKDICLINVRPSPLPVFVEKEFYVRIGNKSDPLYAIELMQYWSTRWPSAGGQSQIAPLSVE
jgi:hypothetical protein